MKKILVLLVCASFAPFCVYGLPQKFSAIEIPMTAVCGAKNSQEECRASELDGAGLLQGVPYSYHEDTYLLGGFSVFSFDAEVGKKRERENSKKSAVYGLLVEAGAALPLGTIKRGYPFYVILQGLLGKHILRGEDDINVAYLAYGGKLGGMFVVDRWHFLFTARFIESQSVSSAPNRLAIGALGVGYHF